MYVVVLAGGGGTRLRPLSRPDRPKPFLPLLGPETLFQQTLLRAHRLGPVHVVVEPRFTELVREQSERIGVAVELLVEPSARNTAAAVALAVGGINRPEDDVMVVLPADHVIADEGQFLGTIAAAERELARSALEIDAPLVTLGIQKTRAATEYGYLLPDPNRKQGPSFGTDHELDAYALRAFEEKPGERRATELFHEPGVAWNAGMFLWQRGAIRRALRDFAPSAAAIADAISDVERERAYAVVDPISIDRAVMEAAAADGRVVMGSMNVGWSDLGNWTALLNALPGPCGAAGRVLDAAESTELAQDDLLVVPDGTGFGVLGGPRDTITVSAPSALLIGARPQEREIRDLIERVATEDTET